MRGVASKSSGEMFRKQRVPNNDLNNLADDFSMKRQFPRATGANLNKTRISQERSENQNSYRGIL